VPGHLFLLRLAARVAGLRITFDTNTLDPVTRPELAGAMQADCLAIHQALASKTLQGSFCETILTVEGGRGSVRPEVVARANRALDLGMRMLRAPRIGGVQIKDPSGDLYRKDPDQEAVSMRLKRYEAITTAIEARGLGFAQVSKVAERLADWASGAQSGDVKPGRESDRRSTNNVARAIAEWADGDSVAAHYAYSGDLFCTEDRARKAGASSVMHPSHRAWLDRAFGVKLVTIAGLAQLIRRDDMPMSRMAH
jgi:hypothetical protein